MSEYICIERGGVEEQLPIQETSESEFKTTRQINGHTYKNVFSLVCMPFALHMYT